MTVEIVRNSSEIWSNLDKFKYLFCVSLILVSGCSVSDLWKSLEKIFFNFKNAFLHHSAAKQHVDFFEGYVGCDDSSVMGKRFLYYKPIKLV